MRRERLGGGVLRAAAGAFPRLEGRVMKGGVGSRQAAADLSGMIRRGGEGGADAATAALDESERSKVGDEPRLYRFYAIAGLATDDYLGSWRNEAMMLFALVGLTIVLTFLAARFVYSKTSRLDSSEGWRLGSELAQHRLLLEKAVAERTLALQAANDRLAASGYSDGLTAIANRRCFDLMLAREWNHALHGGAPLALVLIEVDSFRSFNGYYGHLTGDQCLKAIARALGQALRRPGQLVARYGGGQFALLLPETSAAEAVEAARLVQRAVWSLALPHAASSIGIVTVSLGVASLVPGNLQLPEELLREADSALYRAKQAGRNCVRGGLDAVALTRTTPPPDARQDPAFTFPHGTSMQY